MAIEEIRNFENIENICFLGELSLDGKKCDTCDDNYYFDEDGKYIGFTTKYVSFKKPKIRNLKI